MSLTLPILSVTASEIATHDDCPARYYHGKQGYPESLLDTNRVAADVSSAVHDALMNFHRQLEPELRRGRLPAREAGTARLRQLLEGQLRRKRLDRGRAEVAARLQLIEPGLERAAELVLADLPGWARDPRTGDPLVWVEGALDHGPEIRAIELQPGARVRTRPDVIGFRVTESGLCRPVVRDYKAKGQIVDPLFDSGILLRAIWIALELANPRCRWFLAGRTLPLDRDRVDL